MRSADRNPSDRVRCQSPSQQQRGRGHSERGHRVKPSVPHKTKRKTGQLKTGLLLRVTGRKRMKDSENRKEGKTCRLTLIHQLINTTQRARFVDHNKKTAYFLVIRSVRAKPKATTSAKNTKTSQIPVKC
ncbi:hypothetical protein QE152_g13505 [Popillia japonica]|uniref:Uncharacterized protein n=1 Tax=Popillia japonica TaxID=7064 RepID=A0AAW1LCV7_POPJA